MVPSALSDFGAIVRIEEKIGGKIQDFPFLFSAKSKRRVSDRRKK